MVIKASTEIRQLVDALASGDHVRREAAVARLAIAGARAVDRLLAAYAASTDADTRIAVLRALEPIGDPRALRVARTAITRGGDEAIAAIATLRALRDARDAAAAADALDCVVTAALDANAERRLRLAAFDALRELPPHLAQRIEDAGGQLSILTRSDRDREAVWDDAVEGRLPDDPAVLRDVVQQRAMHAPLPELGKLIDAVSERESSVKAASRRDAWRSVRGALHQAVALRGSRLAVYDLRETVEQAAEPLPASFLTALHAAGDESCLPAIAAAHARAADGAWRAQLREAFRAIVRRKRITKRHAVMKRVAAKWPAVLE